MAESQENWLQLIVNQWQPDVIHTLGLDPAGYYYYRVRNHYGLKTGKWILQLRGGSDLALNRLIPETRARIMELIKESDQILSDNLQNVKYLREMNAREDQFSSLIPIPGTGGLDIGRLSALRVVNASQSREIVFPKGYELPWSKCLPVFEALKLCWDRIAPCKVHILNITPEIRSWFYSLPDPIRESCVLHDRIPRDDFFLLLARARILLIPSLVDGVPNSLYEAMALGVFPIVSPLETICSVVENGKNVLFARNLYPDEIGDALSQAMTDDALVERVVENNRELVAKIADREAMKIRVTAYYQKLSERILETK
jgi:glycosyltransferase involved in cell wall biosynthesis